MPATGTGQTYKKGEIASSEGKKTINVIHSMESQDAVLHISIFKLNDVLCSLCSTTAEIPERSSGQAVKASQIILHI